MADFNLRSFIYLLNELATERGNSFQGPFSFNILEVFAFCGIFCANLLILTLANAILGYLISVCSHCQCGYSKIVAPDRETRFPIRATNNLITTVFSETPFSSLLQHLLGFFFSNLQIRKHTFFSHSQSRMVES